MKTVKFRHNRVKALLRSKAKGLGFFESITLRIKGLIDGGRGLPKQEGTGWSSPFLHRELNRNSEHCARLWGISQLVNETKYIRLRELSELVPQLQDSLTNTRHQLAKELAASDCSARHGEERLTPGQILRRRSTEREKRLSPIRSELSALESRFSKSREELISLYCYLTEDRNSTRALCAKSMEHTRQRIDLYWGSCRIRHNERENLPAAPDVHPVFRAEEAHLSNHAAAMKQAEALLAGMNTTKEAV